MDTYDKPDERSHATRLSLATPCCGVPVRLDAVTTIPVQRHDRTCSKCGLVYVLTRTTLVERTGTRVDQVMWD